MRLILASASPRRAELLTSSGFTFDVVPAGVDEIPRSGEAPKAYALRVAKEKASAVAVNCRTPGSVILSADTVVVASGQILGKPADREEAKNMLKMLSDAVHEVHTAVVVQTEKRQLCEVVTTRVHVLPLSESEITWYIETGEPEGKAGAYAIQGSAARFIDWIEGSWSNVVGLPVAAVYALLKQAGVRS